jgi:hypothetical protein
VFRWTNNVLRTAVDKGVVDAAVVFKVELIFVDVEEVVLLTTAVSLVCSAVAAVVTEELEAIVDAAVEAVAEAVLLVMAASVLDVAVDWPAFSLTVWFFKQIVQPQKIHRGLTYRVASLDSVFIFLVESYLHGEALQLHA